jgi:hypothetical protein
MVPIVGQCKSRGNDNLVRIEHPALCMNKLKARLDSPQVCKRKIVQVQHVRRLHCSYGVIPENR